MMKQSSKRRRTKQEIKDEKEEAKRTEKEIQDKLAKFEDIQVRMS